MLLTSLLKADMSVSRERGRALNPPVKASSKCSAMKGVPFPLWAGGTFRLCGSESSLIPFISPSTSSNESTTPELAGNKIIQQNSTFLYQSSVLKSKLPFHLMDLLNYKLC